MEKFEAEQIARGIKEEFGIVGSFSTALLARTGRLING